MRFLVALIASLLLPAAGGACTTILVGKDLTVDGSVLHAHNEDMGHAAEGRLWAVPAASHQADARLRVPYVELEQASSTLGYWASGNVLGTTGLGTSEASRPYDSILVGLNERGVSMSCNWAHSKDDAEEGVGLRRYAIRQLLLERAQSARHGVELLGRWIENYGQADWGGLIYHLADPDEAWVVETTAHHWVARRVRDDEIRVTANRFRIGTDYDLSSAGLVTYAIEKGWTSSAGGPLDFAQVYGKEGWMDQPYDTLREIRADRLLRNKLGAVTPEDLVFVLRDRYDGTELYTPPQSFEVWREDLAERPSIHRTISTNLAQSTLVAHHRRHLPTEVGSVLWIGLGVPNYTGYAPLYAGAVGGADRFRDTAAAWNDGSVWRLFRRIQRAADSKPGSRQLDVQAFWTAEHAVDLERLRRVEAGLNGGVEGSRLRQKLEALSWSALARVQERGRRLSQHLH